ncbi:MAG: NAD(P)-dependent oxidoreductase [Pseudomonadota bacterium]
MMKVTVLGLGAMGSRMAGRLLDAGYALTVWNRNADAGAVLEARGAVVAATPAAAVAAAELVISVVRDDEAARDLWLAAPTGALSGLRPGTLVIESSTLTVDCVRALGSAVSEAGAAFLDAPVLGSRPQAEAGQLIHLVGGSRAALERAEPVLASLGSARIHGGPVGSGAALKLIANLLFAIQVAALGELPGRIRELGLDPQQTFAQLAGTPVLSPAAAGAAALIVNGQHAPLFPVELVAKDMRYALGVSADAMPVGAACAEVFERAIQRGLGAANLTVVAELYGGAAA